MHDEHPADTGFMAGGTATHENQEKSLAVMSGRKLHRTEFTPVGRDESRHCDAADRTCSSLMRTIDDKKITQ